MLLQHNISEPHPLVESANKCRATSVLYYILPVNIYS